MRRFRLFFSFNMRFTALSILLLVAFLSLFSAATPVSAQCGTSASSCKNCHEVNAKHPVNAYGAWHTSHAFGDFCSFCHLGNVQTVDQKEAHQGMIYPLADPKGSCQSCHADDYTQKAEVYAALLGTKLNTGAASGSATSTGGSTAATASTAECKPIDPPGELNASGSLIDYNRRYNVEVLGQYDTAQSGNLVLVFVAVLLTLGGGALVWHFEGLGAVWHKARAVPDDDWRRQAYSGDYAVSGPIIPTIPTQPAATTFPLATPVPTTKLPKGIEKLDPQTQAALNTLLADPEHGAAIIRALSRLDPVLINSLQHLDKKDRTLLLAIVEELGESES
jgi:hypothetical protein